MKRNLQIISVVVMGDERPSFFVDLVEDNSWSNLRCFDDAHQARKYARDCANSTGLRVDDKTLRVAA